MKARSPKMRTHARRLKLEQMHMNVYIFKQVSPSLKRTVGNFTLYMDRGWIRATTFEGTLQRGA